MATWYERLEARWERWYPTILGVISAIVVSAEAPHGFHLMEKAQWKWDTLYGTAFNLAAVTTPFIFTFYTIFITTETGFIGRMKNTRAYNLTVNYTVSAMWSGAAMIACSMPLTLIVPKASSHVNLWTYIIAVWFGIVVTSIASFYRALRMFQIFISIQRVFRPNHIRSA